MLEWDLNYWKYLSSKLILAPNVWFAPRAL